jgi:F-type H+-transporting ATPase subunit epsilon
MQLKILLPTMVLLDAPVTRVLAEGANGSCCLLPKHTDFVTALVPGILTWDTPDGQTRYAAVGEGILVKTDGLVRVSTRHAVPGKNLGSLRATAAQQFRLIDDRERSARSAVARLEADFVRRFLVLKEPSHVG